MTTKSYIVQSLRAKTREEEPFLALEIGKCLEWLNHTIRARAKKQTREKKETLILTPISIKLSLLIWRVKNQEQGPKKLTWALEDFITLIALLKVETQGAEPWLSSSAHYSHFSWMQVDKQCSFLCVRAPVINVWVTTPLGC